VVARLLWPRISWTARRSAPPSSKCVAALCPPPALAQEHRGPAPFSDQLGPPAAQPVVHSEGGGNSERHGAFPIALADNVQGPPVVVDVIDVQPSQFPDPDAGCVQQLDHGPVPQRYRPAVCRISCQLREEPLDLPLLQDMGQAVVPARGLEAKGRVRVDQFLPHGPPREASPRRCPAGNGGARHAGRVQAPSHDRSRPSVSPDSSLTPWACA
jgi:hypothetical protein